jgi:hypothetical protein
MSELVRRLRLGADYEHDTVVMTEAADEIERLRAAAGNAAWKKTSDEPPKTSAVVATLSGAENLRLAKLVDGTYWIECWRDGSPVFDRCGSIVYLSAPDWWCELPTRNEEVTG